MPLVDKMTAVNGILDWVSKLATVLAAAGILWIATQALASSNKDIEQDTKLASISEFLKSQSEVNKQVIILSKNVAILQDREDRR